ncbi:porin [Wohlfahrtiimonas chitiniclastica]|uniref:porin n=1 Tax=Wohlfahrtiimonas chitiniclastica TaxID=400946 RepID=UPI001BCDC1EC|nr:porin [Wohlfahrtiimonas chitiniclastica]MBS7814935.1 porin [Wohlfahrtiimonas chitiniclastica]MBS7826668.1 porin [Wohlfahrtiimonas chitiniclastica]MBS7828769.1 porin [Wohlfahrtiimonas chitiniclastica]
MKKSLVVVALAGAMAFTAASAETVLYGSIRLGAEVSKNHFDAERNAQDVITGVKAKRGLEMKDFGSRLGLKGSEDLGNGTKVIYQLEWGFNGMEGGATGEGFENRLAYIGLTGDWGTVALGRQNNPFTESLNAGTIADEFNGDYTSALRYATGAVFSSPEQGVTEANTYVMPTRVGNSIAYVSPSFSGFSFTVAGIAQAPKAVAGSPENTFNAAGNKSKGFDIYTVGLNYEHESGFYAKAAYLGTDLYENAKRGNAYGLNVGFANEQFGVNADFGGAERGRKNGQDQAKISSKGWDVGAQFSFGPDYFSTVRATVGQSTTNYKYEADPKVKDKMTVWALGFEQKLSTRTKVWAEFAKENRKLKETGVSESAKRHNDVFSLGIRHDF